MNDVSPDLDVPINLYWGVLRHRPHGHSDGPFILLSLGTTLQARYQRQYDEADEAEAQSPLSQILDAQQIATHITQQHWRSEALRSPS